MVRKTKQVIEKASVAELKLHLIKRPYHNSLVLCALGLVDLAGRILKYGPLDFVVCCPARFNFQQI